MATWTVDSKAPGAMWALSEKPKNKGLVATGEPLNFPTKHLHPT